jgi:hypothetical protein
MGAVDGVGTAFVEEEDLGCRYSHIQSDVRVSKAVEDIGKLSSGNGLQVCGGVTNVDYNRSQKSFRVCYNEDFDIMAAESMRKKMGYINNSITRWKRMKGFSSLWVPGTDHAGIATQSIAEKKLLKEQSKYRSDFTREQFLEKVWEWKNEYGNRICELLILIYNKLLINKINVNVKNNIRWC